MIVADASAILEWLLGMPLAGAVAERFADADQTLHAPHLLGVEVAQVVRRHVASGEISAARGGEAIADLADLDVAHHPHEPLLPAMWRLRANLTMYDAAYVALAEALDCPLVTLDARMAGAPATANRHRVTIDLVR
ncbi:MAG: type II toxin-antitoxin system VapC family toxin [Acidimicrobiia bacterium]|nr:type II toxin-antitoxin system VapC family toxin [Acidimicrobiia bacterium]MDQ3391925.1 type II toxin-antitoxin system VapC family toxin [Actinomycetota bacterium]